MLIHGASGGVGIAATQIGRASGLTVFGTAGTQEGLRLVKESGAHKVFNHKDPKYMEEIVEATDGEGVDLILEMLSNVNLGHDLSILKKFGVAAVIGCRGPVEINPRLLMMKESSVVGVMLYSATDDEWKEMGAAIGSGMSVGWLKPVIHKDYPLDQVAQAHKDIIDSAGAKGKLVLTI